MPHKTKKNKTKLGIYDLSKCHPSRRGSRSSMGCLPSSVYSHVSKSLGVDKSKIHTSIGCTPGADHCMIGKLQLNKKLRRYLRPEKPIEWYKKPNTWLDNFNIEHVLKQYQEAYSWFKFLGVFPIDFASPSASDKNKCLYPETCSLTLRDEYAKGIRGIGIIFNLDPHHKGGSHWVGMYIDLRNIDEPFIGYYDSYGYKVPIQMARYMRSFKTQIPTCKLGYNGRRFQYGNSECGMFSTYFIICMINGIAFKRFCKDSVADGFMLQLRDVLFST
jgi:hypothetical protein